MIYKCKHFKIQELVPPEVYNSADEKDVLWMIFDPLALQTLDALRDRYGPATVNEWVFGGGFQYRGYRPPEIRGVGARWSQHKFGRAFDVSFKRFTAEEVRQDVRVRVKDTGLRDIRRIEEDVSWLHFDTGNYVGDGIKFFKP